MATGVIVVIGPSTIGVNPTATELDRWIEHPANQSRVTLENLDAAQILNGWLESRPVAGAGSFALVGESIWAGMGPLEARDQRVPDSTMGAGELRFMATFSGAGGDCIYTRRRLHEVQK